MNQRPFISSNLNIYDETRCIFSSSFIGGQPVLISQEQNRKTCDTIMTSIASNQPSSIGNCSCPNQQQTPANPSWACSLQAQKQGTPGGVIFNFPQPNYSVPLTCIPSAYNPPPPPAPQIVECPYKTPQSVCTDFRKYGLEAMTFQDKLRTPCSFFSYDKKVGTSDQFMNTNSNLCCCGTQSTTLTADQKLETMNRVDDTDCKNRVKVLSWESGRKNNEECFCFPKEDPENVRCAQTKRKGEPPRDFNTFNQPNQNSISEQNVCYDLPNRFDCSKATCLKKPDCYPKDNGKPKKCVSFSFCDKTLTISENKNSHENSKQSDGNDKFQNLAIEKPLIYRSVNVAPTIDNEEIDNDRYQCDIIRQITFLKRKRKGLIRMHTSFNHNLADTMIKIDNEIENLRSLCQGSKRKTTNKTVPRRSGTSRLGEGYEEFKPKDDNLQKTDNKFNPKRNISVTPQITNNPQNLDSREEISEVAKELTSEKIFTEQKIEELNADTQESIEARIILEQILSSAEESDEVKSAKIEGETQNENHDYDEVAKHVESENRQTDDNKIVNDSEYLQKYIDLNKDMNVLNSKTKTVDYTNLRRNAVGNINGVKTGEDSFPKGKPTSTQLNCAKGLKSCVPNCRLTEPPERSLEDLTLISNEDTNNETPQLVDEQNTMDNYVSSEESPDRASKLNYEPSQSIRDLWKQEVEIDEQAFSDRHLEKPTLDKEETGFENGCECSSGCNNQAGTRKMRKKRRIIEPKSKERNKKKCSSNKTLHSKYSDTYCCNEEINEISHRKFDDLQVLPMFRPCTCSDNFISRCGSTLYTLVAEILGKVRNIWQFGTSPQQVCMPLQTTEPCSSREQNRYLPECSSRHSRISVNRFGTNKYCGKTCYDVDTNRWYSCCSHTEEHIVQITFRETAEERAVLLTDGCRNSKFYVVYE